MALVETAPGVRLYVEEDGEGDPVIFVHGGSMTHSVWEHQVTALNKEFRTVTYDLRGIGNSDRAPGTYSVDTFATDLIQLIDALHIGSAAVVGYALGAHVALRLVAMSPSAVSKLVLVAGAPWFVNPSGGGGLSPQLWQRMRTRSAIDRGQADLALIDNDLFLNTPSEGMRLWCARMASQWPLPMFDQLAATLSSVDHSASLAAIDVPTLVVHGRHDHKTPHVGGVHLAERIRNARLVTMEGSAHCPPLEEVALFNSILLDFLRSDT